MSEKNDILHNEDATKRAEMGSDNVVSRVVVKRKRFKKSDILALAICLVVSVAIWMYASNLEKTAADNEINKAVIEDAVQSGVQSGINKTTGSSENEESSLNSEQSSSEPSTDEDNVFGKTDVFGADLNKKDEKSEIDLK